MAARRALTICTHNYYGKARSINQQAWDFLKAFTLDADPVFIKYQIMK
jgi:hypothetical protein